MCFDGDTACACAIIMRLRSKQTGPDTDMKKMLSPAGDQWRATALPRVQPYTRETTWDIETPYGYSKGTGKTPPSRRSGCARELLTRMCNYRHPEITRRIGAKKGGSPRSDIVPVALTQGVREWGQIYSGVLSYAFLSETFCDNFLLSTLVQNIKFLITFFAE